MAIDFGRTNQPSASPAVAGVGTVNLSKGQRVSLTKENPNLNKIHVGLGWDVNQVGGTDFDLDASLFLLGKSGKVDEQRNFIFFNNLQNPNGSVRHTGDNLTGAGDGDDESIKVELTNVPMDVEKIVFTVSIYQAVMRKQNFGMVSNAFIRIVDEASGKELLRYDLTEDYSLSSSLIVGELYRHNGEWKFNAVGTGVAEEINGLVARYLQ